MFRPTAASFYTARKSYLYLEAIWHKQEQIRYSSEGGGGGAGGLGALRVGRKRAVPPRPSNLDAV